MRLGFIALALALGLTNAHGSAADALPRDLPGTGQARVSLEIPKNGALALVFYSTECPISNELIPTLNAIAAENAQKPVKIVGVCVDPDLADKDVAEHARAFQLKYPVARDRYGKLSAKVGATITPEAYVYRSSGELAYHGRIDDQFAGRGKRLAVPTTHELADAIAAVVGGRPIVATAVKAVGCPLPQPAVEAEAAPTFSGSIAAILQKNCQECHRPGEVGPFSLVTYAQAKKRADDIARVVEGRSMPPWKPTPGFGPKFKSERSLSEAEIKSVIDWAEAGAPEGDAGKAPAPATFASGWKLGTPDLVLKMPHEYTVPAAGEDIYRCFVIPSGVTENRWVEAVEYRPGNRRVVHHVLGFVEAKGEARKRDAAEPGEGYTCFGGPEVEIQGELAGWAPGNEQGRLPEGIGRFFAANGDVILQVHYHPSGKEERDQTEIGIHFSKKPVKKSLHTFLALNEEFVLKPGAKNQEVKAEWEFPVDAELRSVTPHMHLIGKDITVTLQPPAGAEQGLVQIRDWDFNWQNNYRFVNPVAAPKGSKLKVLAHYDNTSGNPRNPNRPPKEVRYGEATTDEMCIGFVSFTLKDQDLTKDSKKDEFVDYLNKYQKERSEKK